MVSYEVNNAPFGTHRLIADELEGGDLGVLDVGCNQGYLGTLVEGAATFTGLDSCDEALKAARTSGYAYVEKIDLDDCRSLELRDKFDVIVFADVLEHLVQPKDVLQFFVSNYLKKDGRVIISLPNVAHVLVRLGLLMGNFTYTDAGILDRTHLHLYTLKTARELIVSCGLRIEKEKFSSDRLGRLIQVVPALGRLLGFNLIFCAKLACPPKTDPVPMLGFGSKTC